MSNEAVQRIVHCVKLNKDLPGLDEPPFDGDLGQRIYNQVSAEAWHGWGEFCKMVL
ncbi:MAG: oxidative damage protection protein, partial [Acidobacteria bacterium]